jgi:enamine deaminase RidA (YjgF/YER057c/UK114 family)
MKFSRSLCAVLITGVIVGLPAPSKKATKEFLNPEGFAKPSGYTLVVSSAPGRMVFLSGLQGRASPDSELPPDFASQAKNTFENIGRCLRAAGTQFQDIVKINYYVTDLANTTELRRIRAQYLNMSAPPASTLVQVGLGDGVLLEVEVTAIVR